MTLGGGLGGWIAAGYAVVRSRDCRADAVRAYLSRMSNHIRFIGLLVLSGACALSCKHTNADEQAPSCGAPGACGGAVDGTWIIDATCTEGDLRGFASATADLSAGCDNAYQSATLTSTGTLAFANGTETVDVTMIIDSTVVYTPVCIGAGTAVAVDADTCTTLQGIISGSKVNTTASCQLAGGNCSCQVTVTTPASAKTLAYSIAGGTITYSNGDPPMDYCVSGSMTTTQLSPDLNGITVVYTLHKG